MDVDNHMQYVGDGDRERCVSTLKGSDTELKTPVYFYFLPFLTEIVTNCCSQEDIHVQRFKMFSVIKYIYNIYM